MTIKQRQYIMQLLPTLSNAEAGRLIGHLQAVENFKRKLYTPGNMNALKFKQTRLV